MLPFNISARKKRQQISRNWSDADIQAVLDYPALMLPTIEYAKLGTPDENATVYYRKDGHYVIRNNTTAEIIQLSGIGNTNWYDEHRGFTVRPI